MTVVISDLSQSGFVHSGANRKEDVSSPQSQRDFGGLIVAVNTVGSVDVEQN